jgi:Mg2+ and Co2+ transporter CorA
MLECVECHKNFPNAHALSCHTSRENSKLKEEDRCGYKFKNKRLAQEKQEEIKQAKRKLSQLDPTKIIETIRDANKASRINDLLKENAELKDQLQNKSEEYLKGLANDEIRKLKSHIQGLEKRIQELESYIEERKDVTSKAEDSRRLWRREFAIANAKCSEDTDKNLFNSLSF